MFFSFGDGFVPAGRSGARYRRSPGRTSCFFFVFVIPVSFRPVFSFPVRYHIEDMHNVDAMVSRQRCWTAFEDMHDANAVVLLLYALLQRAALSKRRQDVETQLEGHEGTCSKMFSRKA